MANSIISVLQCKCPRCQKGNLFTNNASFNIPKMMEMPDKCPVCGLDFHQEPGYYYGAMFVSYGFATLELVLVLLLLTAFWGTLSILTTVAIVAVVFSLMSPLNFRWGRSGWIAIFYRKDKEQ
jgi:uncharacterized protein (DUF983 family)